jgi:hypothetical protein
MDDQTLAQALQAADFETVQHAAVDYGRSVRTELDATTNPQRRIAIYEEALESLQNHLHLARVLRAHLAVQIQGNAGSCLYAQPEADRHRWQVEA